MSERSDAIAAALRKEIERGEYDDGERLSQSRLSLKYGAHRDVIGHALYLLEFEGYVSQDARHAYHANASYQTRQVQMALNKLDHITWTTGRTLSPGQAAMAAKLNPRLGHNALPRGTAQPDGAW
jgi:DNA-binding transcriptional MocR family regulator